MKNIWHNFRNAALRNKAERQPFYIRSMVSGVKMSGLVLIAR